jgi:hypothetical protein
MPFTGRCFSHGAAHRGIMTQPTTLIARPRAPGWISCELCVRPASRPHRRLRLTLVRHNKDQIADDRANDNDSRAPNYRDNGVPGREAVPRNDAANFAMLVLLCADCCALIVGTIDDDEWHRRLNDSPSRGNLSMLLPPPA